MESLVHRADVGKPPSKSLMYEVWGAFGSVNTSTCREGDAPHVHGDRSSCLRSGPSQSWLCPPLWCCSPHPVSCPLMNRYKHVPELCEPPGKLIEPKEGIMGISGLWLIIRNTAEYLGQQLVLCGDNLAGLSPWPGGGTVLLEAGVGTELGTPRGAADSCLFWGKAPHLSHRGPGARPDLGPTYTMVRALAFTPRDSCCSLL